MVVGPPIRGHRNWADKLRNFRVERIEGARMLAERFQDPQGRLLAQWLALPKQRVGDRPSAASRA